MRKIKIELTSLQNFALLWGLAWFLRPGLDWLTQDGAWTLSSAWATLHSFAFADPVAGFRQPGIYGWFMSPLVALSGGNPAWMAAVFHVLAGFIWIGIWPLTEKWPMALRKVMMVAIAFHPVWTDQRPEWLGAFVFFCFLMEGRKKGNHPFRTFWLVISATVHPVAFISCQWALLTGLAGRRPHWHWVVIPWAVFALLWIASWGADSRPGQLILTLWERWENFSPAHALRAWLDTIPFLLISLFTLPIWIQKPKVLRGWATLFLLLIIPGKSYYLVYADVWILVNAWILVGQDPSESLMWYRTSFFKFGLILIFLIQFRPFLEFIHNRHIPLPRVTPELTENGRQWVEPTASFGYYHPKVLRLYYSDPFSQKIAFPEPLLGTDYIYFRHPWQVRSFEKLWMKNHPTKYALDTLSTIQIYEHFSVFQGWIPDTFFVVRAYIWADWHPKVRDPKFLP